MIHGGPTSIDIDAKFATRSIFHGMLLPELVENVCGVKARIVTQLPGNDLQGLGISVDEELALPSN